MADCRSKELDQNPRISRRRSRDPLWVARQAGVPISSAAIRHINANFVLEREGAYHRLFTDTDLTAYVEPLVRLRGETIAAARETLAGEEPEVLPGTHCNSPFACDIANYCSAKLPTRPEWPVTVLPNGGGKSWIEKGIHDLLKVDPSALTNPMHKRIHRATATGEAYHDKEGAQAAMAGWTFPRTWLDFETIGFAIPRWLGTRPYQQVPIQFSAHVELEGAHFFGGLQAVTCPLGEQPMTGDHVHAAGSSISAVYESARAEAAKILGQREDLAAAIKTLDAIRERREKERAEANATLELTDRRIADVIAPALKETTARLNRLVVRRVELEGRKADDEQAEALRTMKSDLERASGTKPAKREWESLPWSALRSLCAEIEAVLKEWRWNGEARVEFDQKAFDIIVDGQARQSHVRACAQSSTPPSQSGCSAIARNTTCPTQGWF